MRITRRGLFATLAAAFVAKPADVGLPLDFVRSFDLGQVRKSKRLIRCECPACQWARGTLGRGGYEWYPDAFALSGPKIGDTIRVKRPQRWRV